MFCNKCGSQNPDGSPFCSNCGAPLTNTTPAAPVAPVAPAAPVAPVTPGAPAPKKKNTGLIIGIVAGVVVLIAAVIGILFATGVFGGNDKDKDSKDDKSTTKAKTEEPSTQSAGGENIVVEEEFNIVGTWTANFDAGDIISSIMAEDDEETAKYFDFSGLKLECVYTYNADGTVAYTFKKGANFDEKFTKAYVDGMTKYLQSMGMSASDFEAETGISLEQYAKQIIAYMDFDESNTAYYKLDGNKLYEADYEDELDEATPDTVKIVSATEMELLSDDGMSITFKKK